MAKIDSGVAIGVLGAGTMGAGIAQIAATCGHSVLLWDINKDALFKAQSHISNMLEKLVEKGRLAKESVVEIKGRIAIADNLQAISGCGLIIEAIIENLEIKQSVFGNMEGYVSGDCILATNTSSLSIASLASSCRYPQRFIGIHFFNPAPVLPLVEVVPGLGTSKQTVRRAQDLTAAWGKTAVIAKDTPGFIVNRIARPFYGEALRILEEGIADIPTIDWAMRELGGFRMGPFELMDLIGNDVNFRVTETIFEEFFYDPRYKPALTQKRMVEARLLGRKTGKGYYDYGSDARNQEPIRDAEQGQDIFFRILVMLINEAADARFYNVASTQDIDQAMTLGVNYPKGLLAWADEIGLGSVLARLNELQEEYGEDRYRPSPLLKKMVRAGQSFYEAQ